MPSDIHVFVRFKEHCVFAGEELTCTITFKNVADFIEPPIHSIGARRTSRQGSISKLAAQSSRNAVIARGGQNARATSGGGQSQNASNRPVTVVSSNAPAIPVNTPLLPSLDGDAPGRISGHKQQRSVSIISITSPLGISSEGDPNASGSTQSRPVQTHRRSSTVQIISSAQHRLSQSPRDASEGLNIPIQTDRRSPLSSAAGSIPPTDSRRSTPDFRPLSPYPADQENVNELQKRPSRTRPSHSVNKDTASPRPDRGSPAIKQVTSERSSAEFYSLSNHSQETLMSEQPSVFSDRPQLPSNMLGQNYRVEPRPTKRPQAVNLLMGYAQLNATFTVDGSMVDQSQFEEVKKKGFLGGQAGGGVVGIKKTRPTSGFLGTFNFNSIGESLNSLVGTENMSSVKEMNAITNSKAIPLLSTPQSLLFVDLHLEPGEEKSYSFAYVLPRGLPSSYRGKTIKISYNLLVGVQGVPGSRDLHSVRQISVPVRVFSGVDSDGEIYGHDLMQPHVILKDTARTKSIQPSDSDDNLPASSNLSIGSKAEFLQFVDTLLDRNRRRQSSTGTMDAIFGGADGADGRAAVQAINRAILFSNQMSADSDSSPNRYDISRGGLRVGVIVIDRALHRLGETVTAIVDFSEAQVSCVSLHATLETAEKVGISLAVRSAATISRISRRVYASHSENVLFSKRSTFAANIPAAATPTFLTSGINLDWCLRFEFGTVKAIEQDDGTAKQNPDLFEEVVKDERGIVNIAVERLDCESFEVVIPLTVYGDIVSDGKEGEEVVGIPL